VHLSQITPSIFASLSLDGAQDFLAMGESPGGRELLFLIDGLGADAIEKYGEFAPAILDCIILEKFRLRFHQLQQQVWQH